MNDVAANSTGPRAVLRDANKEWETYDSLPKQVRKILQEAPFEFSAADAKMVWDYCEDNIRNDWFQTYSFAKHLALFESQMRLNIQNMLLDRSH